MIIDYRNEVLILTKKEYAAATKFDTYEYHMLKEVKKDYPEYTLTIKSTPHRHTPYSTLTYDEMLRMIVTVDESRVQEFENLRAIGANYAVIKKWFLTSFVEYLS